MIKANKGDNSIIVTKGFFEAVLKGQGWSGKSTKEPDLSSDKTPGDNLEAQKAELMIKEYQDLKELADEIGVDYPGNISKENLVLLILKDQNQEG